jgi:phage/plasmid primase-like uncharacterized protein
MAMTPLHERARGRWYGILLAIGINEKFLKRKNGPCPMCGGTDRWRFTDINGKGTWWCNNCHGGNGFALVMKFTGRPFRAVAQRIEHILGDAPVEPIRAERSEGSRRAALNALWQSGRPVHADDPVDRWLHARGVGMQNYPHRRLAGAGSCRALAMRSAPPSSPMSRNSKGDQISRQSHIRRATAISICPTSTSRSPNMTSGRDTA